MQDFRLRVEYSSLTTSAMSWQFPNAHIEYIEWPCGCYVERKGSVEGDTYSLGMEMCTECYDMCMNYLEQLVLDEKAQLGLDLTPGLPSSVSGQS